MNDNKHHSLRIIPGVGKIIEQDFHSIGIRHVDDLQGKDPEDLYQHMCIQRGFQIDRCMLYVCRTAVYFAEHPKPDPEKLKWWHWKDAK